MNVRTVTNTPGPKLYLGLAAAVVTYLVSQEVLDLPVWADVALNAAGVGLAVYLGKPQQTVTETEAYVVPREGGYGLVEAVVAVLLVLILVVVLLRLI